MITLKDPNQIIQAEHDETLNAKKVRIVGGDFGIKEAIQDGLKDIWKYNSVPSLPIQTPQFWPNEIEKEVLVKEYNVLEIPKIITEYKTIEVPVIKEQIKIVEIEKPIIVKEIEIKEIEVKNKDMNRIMILFFIGQLIILTLSKFMS